MSTIYIPKKRIYAANDPFFEEGNIALRAIWLKKQAESEYEVDMIQEELTELQNHTVSIYCDECRIELPNVTAFECHYEAVHRNVCSVCHKIFPGSDWLQLHLDEFHNILNTIKKERGGKIHKCYVKDCEKMFSEPRMRRLHLIDKHHYPKYFLFDLVYTGTLSFEQRRIRDQKNKARLNNRNNTHSSSNSKDVDMDELTNRVSKLSIPTSISFGKKSRSIPQHRHIATNNKKESIDVEMNDAPIPEQKKYPYPRKRGPKKKKTITTTTDLP